MGTVVNLSDRKPHSSGPAHCMVCKYEWVAIAPVGVVWLECSNCGSMKGLFKYSCQREGSEWVCNCGNTLFCVTPDGTYCPNCGEWQKGF